MFIRVVVGRFYRVNLTEITAAGGLRTTNKEGGFTGFPALVNIWTSSFLADGGEIFGFDPGLQCLVFGTHFCASFDPLGLALNGSLGVANLEPQHLSTVGSCHAAATSLHRNRVVKAPITVSMICAGERSRASSRLIVVTPASRIPQATILLYASSELLQLSATPCRVTPFSTRIPIAAILFSKPGGPTQTPDRPSTLRPLIPHVASTSMRIPSMRRT